MSRKTTIPVLLIAVVLAGCGSNGDDSATTTEAAPVADTSSPATTASAPATTAPEEPEATTTTAVETSSNGGSDISVATVTVGGDTYQFQTTGFAAEVCNPDFFGGVQVVLAPADDNGDPLVANGRISPLGVVLIPEDLADDAPLVEFTVPGGETEWIANADSTDVSGSSVDEWSVDGSVVTGSATFVSTSGDGPIAGTFEVVCVEE